MNPEHALLVLKEERKKLSNTLTTFAAAEESGFIQFNSKIKTKTKHQIGSIDVAIEILETWED